MSSALPSTPFGAPRPRTQPGVAAQTLLVVEWLFYGLAILVTAVRLTLRVRDQKHLQPDDYLLLFACACLTAASVSLSWGLGDIYEVIDLTLNPLLAPVPADLVGLANRVQITLYVFMTVTWASIFATKFSYLLFFRQLVDRIRPLVLYWTAIVALTSIACVFCILQAFISCPYVGLQALQCGQGVNYTRSFSISNASMVLDVLTDFLIASIPICLLYRVRIKTSQKIGLAVFLCLSVVLAALAIVLVSGLRLPASQAGLFPFDTAWAALWRQIEACVAVGLVSLTAFRSLFMARGGSNRPSPQRSWYSSTLSRLKRRAKRTYEQDLGLRLPAIPSASVTGLRTFIRGGPKDGKDVNLSGSTQTNNSGFGIDDYLPEEKDIQPAPPRIRVTGEGTPDPEWGRKALQPCDEELTALPRAHLAHLAHLALPLYQASHLRGSPNRSWLELNSPASTASSKSTAGRAVDLSRKPLPRTPPDPDVEARGSSAPASSLSSPGDYLRLEAWPRADGCSGRISGFSAWK